MIRGPARARRTGALLLATLQLFACAIGRPRGSLRPGLRRVLVLTGHLVFEATTAYQMIAKLAIEPWIQDQARSWWTP